MNTAQQILAIDTRYNTYRSSNNPQLRTLYLKRRTQLLNEKALKEKDPSIRRKYFGLRKQLLARKYGPISVAGSVRSSLRSRTSSIEASFDNLHIDPSSPHEFRPTHRRFGSTGFGSGSSFGFVYKNEQMADEKKEGVIPTTDAAASRAMAGNTSLSENYAFAGMSHIFDQHGDAVTGIKFGHNDKFRLVCSSMDGTLSICNLSTSPPSVTCMLRGHSKGVMDFDWSLSNDFIVSASLDGTARVWDSSSGQNVRVLPDTYDAAVLSCRFVPLNNNIIVTGNKKGYVQVFNMSTGKCAKGGSAKALGPVRALEFDTSGNILWSGDDKGSVFAFSINMLGKLQRTRRIIIADGCPVTSISCRTWISREARDPSLLINCMNNRLYLYGITSSDGSLQLKSSFPVHHKKHMIRSSFCPLMSLRKGACVVTASEDMAVYFYNVERADQRCLNKLLGHSAPVLDVCWNYDESQLASCDTEGTVIVWKREQLT
ncbi:WD repeat-containing protein 13-like [Rhopilema esculentum]|uniref:WD repeat-containing protein 13-like n=1 Tax=Rhopilema esculentum TaxID=499914 RepID=UPI0031DED638